MSDADARTLLESILPGRLDERVRDRLVAETRGNPLALVGLTRGLTAAEMAGGFGRPGTQPRPASPTNCYPSPGWVRSLTCSGPARQGRGPDRLAPQPRV